MNFRMIFNERRQIQELLDHGTEIKDIAKVLNRSASAISSEIKRNGGKRLYNAIDAQKKSDDLKILANIGKNSPMEHLRMRVEELEKKVEQLLNKGVT